MGTERHLHTGKVEHSFPPSAEVKNEWSFCSNYNVQAEEQLPVLLQNIISGWLKNLESLLFVPSDTNDNLMLLVPKILTCVQQTFRNL
jgi:hypothetical protein